MVFPVTIAAAAKSGGPGAIPFGLFEAEDGGRRAVSAIDCTEFCLALAEAGLAPFAGAGDARTGGLISGNVVRIGEDANEGDIAAVAALFLNEHRLATVVGFSSGSYIPLSGLSIWSGSSSCWLFGSIRRWC